MKPKQHECGEDISWYTILDQYLVKIVTSVGYLDLIK